MITAMMPKYATEFQRYFLIGASLIFIFQVATMYSSMEKNKPYMTKDKTTRKDE